MKLWPFWKSSSSFKSVIYRFRLLTLSSNVGYDLWLWKKKGNSQAQKVFKGFKDLGSTSSFHQLSFYYCLCRRMTYNHVNFKKSEFSSHKPWCKSNFSLMNKQSKSFKDMRGNKKIMIKIKHAKTKTDQQQ